MEHADSGITISADNPRTIRALQIAADADQWQRWRTAEGHEAFGVPSQRQANHFYVVTRSTCDCQDFRNNVLAPWLESSGEPRACKHILAVRLYSELVKAQHLLRKSAA